MYPTWYWIMSATKVRLSALGLADSVAVPNTVGRDEWAGAEWFSAFLHDPRFMLHDHGYSNVHLGVYDRGMVIVPATITVLVHGWKDPIEYHWPAVVLKTRSPLRSAGVLVDVCGEMGACVTHEGARLRRALDRAGLTVVEVRRGGMTRRVQPRDLGTHLGDVPLSIVRR